MNLCDIKNIKQIMSVFGIKFHKEFGQNFLTNKMVVEDIAEYCCDGKSNTILEIGPGIGTLTVELAERYENEYGPIRQENTRGGEWKWVSTPWPWQLDGNGKER